MTYLEVGLESPAISRGDDPNRVVPVDYNFVTRAMELAGNVSRDPNATSNEKELADAIYAFGNVLTEIVGGLAHGRLTVHNYPLDGAHLESA